MWAMVVGARCDRASLEALLRSYWSPVYAFIRRQGYSGHDASDLTQDFMTQVVVGRDLVGRADPTRGRFRAFLKQALRNFLIDQHRLGKAHKGGKAALRPGTPEQVSLSSDVLSTAAEATPAVKDDSLDGGTFDREWAAALLEHTLDRLESACRAEGMEAHWTAFNINVLGPTLRRTSPMPLDQLAKLIDAAGPDQASNMLQTVKRRFRRTLRDVVSETVGDPSQVDDELAELRTYLGA